MTDRHQSTGKDDDVDENDALAEDDEDDGDDHDDVVENDALQDNYLLEPYFGLSFENQLCVQASRMFNTYTQSAKSLLKMQKDNFAD